MVYLHTIIILFYVFIIVATILKVLLDNRPPAKTMAWIMVLSFVPVVGFVLYIFFGRNTRKMKFISQRSLDELTRRSMLEFVEQRDLRLPEKYKTLIQLFANQSLSLPFKNTDADIFTSGHDYFLALLREIGKAHNHIHIDVYIMDDDPLGFLVADALIDKAREGVEVRLIYDDVGCWNVKNAFFERMRREGIDVRAFMPVKFPAFTSKVNYRNHRKLCVIDGRTAFIGGMNIALRYVKGTKDGMVWRDTHLMIRGGAVFAIQCAFLVDWYFVSRTLVNDLKYYPPTATLAASGGALAQVVTSSPVAPWPDIMQGYVRILLEARHYVYIETPYFLPTEPIMFAIRTAALAGVDVRVMLPYKSDSRLVELASTAYVLETMESGVKVFLYKGGFNHSKMLIADDSLCTCGSANVDVRSFENNFEANIFFYDKDMAQRMKRIYLEDQKQCVQLDESIIPDKRPFTKRLLESLIRLLSPLL